MRLLAVLWLYDFMENELLWFLRGLLLRLLQLLDGRGLYDLMENESPWRTADP